MNPIKIHAILLLDRLADVESELLELSRLNDLSEEMIVDLRDMRTGLYYIDYSARDLIKRHTEVKDESRTDLG
jgi:hypothetical protein